MKNFWTLQDSIDLDYFCSRDLAGDDLDGQDRHRRERDIFLQSQYGKEDRQPTHAECLRLWLAHHRLESIPALSSSAPGKWFEEILVSFKYLLLFAGLLLGCVSGLSYFAYTGRTPLNVFTFFSIFILPQLLLLCVFLLRSAAAKLMKQPLIRLHRTAMPLFIRFTGLVKKITKANLPCERHYNTTQLLRENGKALFNGPLFICSQLFGIAFNLGLVGVTLFKITTTDLAFGWQTTLQFGSETLYSWIHILALPWSWMPAAAASLPTLSEIEGSRIILKDGIYHLLTENLTSWWPFLLLCLLFYGLLPRLILMLYGFFLKRQGVRRFLGQRRFRAISRRMLTPLVSTQAAVPPAPVDTTAKTGKKLPQAAQKETRQKNDCVVLVPDEIFSPFTPEIMAQLLSPSGYQSVEKKRFLQNYVEDRLLLEEMSRLQLPLVVLLEAWMAPITEHLLFLQDLEKVLPADCPLCICLLGKPGSSEPYSRARPEQARLWREKIRQSCPDALIFEPQPTSHTMEGRQS
ncbi:MAG: DUF2868 domain-containing protein [Desulfopila sp.]|jgi:hypothetical protein|nr:DUF2868 domain-containing protein [Desulfopila sp.]